MIVVQILSAALTPLIAILAAYIAWQQHQLSRNRYRHELYDRRLKVFQAIRAYLSDIAREGKTRFQRPLQFYAETSEAEFLFGKDVIDLIDELYQRGVKLAVLYEQLYPESGERGLPVGEERSRVSQESSDVLRALLDKLPRIKSVFKPYLSVEEL